eukprot:66331_1
MQIDNSMDINHLIHSDWKHNAMYEVEHSDWQQTENNVYSWNPDGPYEYGVTSIVTNTITATQPFYTIFHVKANGKYQMVDMNGQSKEVCAQYFRTQTETKATLLVYVRNISKLPNWDERPSHHRAVWLSVNRNNICNVLCKKYNKRLLVNCSNLKGVVGFTNVNKDERSTIIHLKANVCYINSVIQSILSLESLCGRFDCWFDAKDEPISQAFASTVQQVQKPGIVELSLDKIKESVGAINPIFLSPNQQDAQEFMTFFLQGLHKERNIVWTTIPANQENNPSNTLPLTTIAELYWKEYMDRNDSVIVDLLTGQRKWQMKCINCTKSSYKFDEYQILQASFPGIKLSNFLEEVQKNTKFELIDCLKNEFEIEKEFEYTCRYCNHKKSDKMT